MDYNSMTSFKLIALLVLYLFLPLTALTYLSRRNRRMAEIDRIFSILKIAVDYRKVYETEGLGQYLWALAYASACPVWVSRCSSWGRKYSPALNFQ